MTPILVANAGAGAAAQLTGEPLDARLGRAFAEAGRSVDVWRVAPGELGPALERARAADRPVIVAGGDGSVSAAVQLFAGTGIPLGVVPLGTYNLLARDLGMSPDIEAAARQLAGGRELTMDLGRIGRRYFHTLAGLGFFSRVARQRDEIRRRLPGARVIGAAVATLRSLSRGGSLDLEISDGVRTEAFRTPAVLITNNLLDPATWRRPRLGEGRLEITVLRGDVPFPLLRGGVAALTGNWRESADVVNWSSSQFTVTSRRPRLFLSLDGETTRPRTPFRFQTVPGALTCLAPAPEAREGPSAGDGKTGESQASSRA
jgi:diacylglycerol kinase family enzyme